MLVPMVLHFVIHLDRSGFVDGDDHRLAAVPTPHKVGDDIFRDGFQSLISRDEVILFGKLPFQLCLLCVVELGGLKNPLKIFVQLFVGEL